MNYDNDIREFFNEIMPADMKSLVSTTMSDLYSGPLYFDEDGDEVSCFDEGAIPFNFSKAVREISDWCDENLVPLYVEEWAGILQTSKPEPFLTVDDCQDDEEDEDDYQQEYEEPSYYEFDIRYIKKILFGELASYL
jgi:hypothetical protein